MFKYFAENGSQNYWAFQLFSSFSSFSSTKTNITFSWQSKGMCEGSIKTPFTSHNSSAPKMICDHGKIRVKFDGIWLRQDGIPFIHGNVAKHILFTN